MLVEAIPAFNDNYIWLLRRPGQNICAVVDPGDATPVLAHLRRHGLELGWVLITHHHGDHVGGVEALLRAQPGARVLGPAGERIPRIHRRLGDGDAVELEALGVRFTVLDVPGHTAGHIAYVGEGCLFCGDTLFACGCGRLFEGTASQMHRSLSRLAALPGETRVYCAHEYTLANIAFARQVEPDNQALAARETHARKTRAEGLPTLPSTIDLERSTNPFLRFDEPRVRSAAEAFCGHKLASAAQVLGAVRRWKDAAPG